MTSAHRPQGTVVRPRAHRRTRGEASGVPGNKAFIFTETMSLNPTVTVPGKCDYFQGTREQKSATPQSGLEPRP